MYYPLGQDNLARCQGTLADPGGQGAMLPSPPPGPVQINHKKDARQRQPHRFHVSCPPTRPLNPLLREIEDCQCGQ